MWVLLHQEEKDVGAFSEVASDSQTLVISRSQRQVLILETHGGVSVF